MVWQSEKWSAIATSSARAFRASAKFTSLFSAMRLDLVRRDRLLFSRTGDLDVLRQALHDLLHRAVYRLVADQRVAVILEIRRRQPELLQDRERDEGHRLFLVRLPARLGELLQGRLDHLLREIECGEEHHAHRVLVIGPHLLAVGAGHRLRRMPLARVDLQLVPLHRCHVARRTLRQLHHAVRQRVRLHPPRPLVLLRKLRIVLDPEIGGRTREATQLGRRRMRLAVRHEREELLLVALRDRAAHERPIRIHDHIRFLIDPRDGGRASRRLLASTTARPACRPAYTAAPPSWLPNGGAPAGGSPTSRCAWLVRAGTTPPPRARATLRRAASDPGGVSPLPPLRAADGAVARR